jgi:hypothetical protein
VPPQNLEAEESVLGAMMISPGAIVAVRDVLDAGDFYRDSHGRIYRAALALHDAGGPVDAITITAELERRGDLDQVGGRIRLHELGRLVPATANVRHYAEIVRENATMRGLIRAGGEIAQLGWEGEGHVEDVVERARLIAEALLERGGHADQLQAQTWAEFERDATEHVPVIVDGLWPEGGLGFIAAPPKKGKTWVGLDLGVSIATGTSFLGRFPVAQAQPVVYVALEGHKAAIRGRIGCLTRGHGFNPSHGSNDLHNLHVLYKPAGLNLADPAWTRSIQQLAQRAGARMLIIDVLRAAAVLKENSNDEFRDLVRTLQPITNDGCALALLHHFGKLTELSRDRTPGERMSGAGAMYGAFDVGVFITGSNDAGRKLRIEFETRDLPSPETVGVELSGTPTGQNGGFIFTDTAYWAEAEKPDYDEIKAPSEDIAAWVREQGGEVERRAVEDHFQISDKTLARRRDKLDELGIEFVRADGRGRKARLIAHVEESLEEQIDLFGETSESNLGHPRANSEVYGTPRFTPLNQAENGHNPETSENLGIGYSEVYESGDLQGEKPRKTSDSLLRREQPPADATAPLRAPANPDDIDFG